MPIMPSKELDFSSQNIFVLISGRPGCGKTTLSLSAESPLLIDLENGVSRVQPCYRKDTDFVNPLLSDYDRYITFLNDLRSADLSNYKTIIIDSLGKLVELMTPKVIKDSPANGQKDGKTLSQKGYGAITLEMKEFSSMIRSFRKDLLIVAHVTEKNDGDIVKTRLSVAGSTKDTVWDDVDLGGYIEFNGKNRIIHFSPSEKWDAKGTHGIEGDYNIPILKTAKDGGVSSDNHFLSDLFTLWHKNAEDESKDYFKDKVIYDKAMKLADAVNSAKTVEELNTSVEPIKTVEHALTSKKELQTAVSKKALELGAKYDKELGRYAKVANETEKIPDNGNTPQ